MLKHAFRSRSTLTRVCSRHAALLGPQIYISRVLAKFIFPVISIGLLKLMHIYLIERWFATPKLKAKPNLKENLIGHLTYYSSLLCVHQKETQFFCLASKLHKENRAIFFLYA